MTKKTGSRSGFIGLILGCAIGVPLGVYVLSPNLSGGGNEINNRAMVELADARAEAQKNNAAAQTSDKYISSISESMVDKTLTGKSVVVFRTSDAADDDVANVEWLLKKAGAATSRINMQEKFLNQDGADGLKSIVANTLPAGAQLSATKLDSGTHAGEAFVAALMLAPDKEHPEKEQTQATESERDLLLNALKEGGFIDFQSNTIAPASVAVIITGNSDGTGTSGFATTNLASFAEALDTKGSGVVVAGDIHSAVDTGTIGQLRKNPELKTKLSTVDSVDRSYGRLATVLAVRGQLDNHSGAYGAAENAESPVPTK